MSAASPIIEGILAVTTKPLEGLGSFTLFLGESIKRCFTPRVRLKLLMQQMEFVGNRSLGIVVIAATMVGAVFALILGDIFRTFGAESMLGAAAGYALSNELAPVFTGFLVTARAGSAMAAEIATMRVNEQIDAMRVMAVNPYNYLVAPRILGGVVMLPLLTCIFIMAGVATSFFIGILIFNVDVGTFFEKLKWIVKAKHIAHGMEKGAVFGIVLTAVGCYKGFFAGGGAKGVGRATTEAVVISLVTILITDFFISYIQFEKVF